MKNVLLIAYAFPPANDSGTARSAAFARHLPEHGWSPTVLTQEGFSEYARDPGLLERVRGRCEIIRVRKDAVGPLARRWPRSLAFTASAIRAALDRSRDRRFDVIWTTFPPSIAIYPAVVLAARLGRPLVVDMRDPWTYGYLWEAKGILDRFLERRFERLALGRAARIVFTSPLTADLMRRRIGRPAADRMVTITNGFEPEAVEPLRDAPTDICLFRHVGIFRSGFRDPRPFLEGLRRVADDPAFRREVRVQLVGGLREFAGLPRELGLEDLVEDLGFVPAAESRRLMRGADVLVLLQSLTGPGRDQVAGKAYEYLATGRTVLGIGPPDGGDAWLLEQAPRVSVLADVRDPASVADGIREAWRRWRDGHASRSLDPSLRARYSQRALAGRLAELLEEIVGNRRSVP